jgi:hypothetical protein
VGELEYLKARQQDIVLDKLSVSDYLAAAAMFMVKEAEGPDLMRQYKYGRQDVKNANEVGDVNQIPNASNYRQNLEAKGFSVDEIAALASLESFGVIADPKKRDVSIYPKLDNYIYQLLSSAQPTSQDLSAFPLRETLTGDGQLKEQVDKFA